MTYRGTKRWLHFLIAGYLVVALILGFRFYHREVFPVFSWSLFSEIPEHKVDFGILVTAIDGNVLEPPGDLMEMREVYGAGGATRAYHTIQDLGGAAMSRDTGKLDAARRTLESLYMEIPGRTVAYRLILRRFDPLERWRGGPYEQIEMGRFELRRTNP